MLVEQVQNYYCNTALGCHISERFPTNTFDIQVGNIEWCGILQNKIIIYLKTMKSKLFLKLKC